MMSLGGVGVIHRFMSIEEQENKVLDVHFYRESQPRGLYNHQPICVGIKDDYLERSERLVENGCDVLLIDVAHGHHERELER